MDTLLWKGFALPPEQMAIFNAILILLFIPIFQGVVYPVVEKFGIRTTPLRRMTAGGFLASITFVVSAFVQLRVNQTLPDIPADNTAFVSIINMFPNCNVNVSSDDMSRTVLSNTSLIDDKVLEKQQLFRLTVGNKKSVPFTFVYYGPECFGYDNKDYMKNFDLKGGKTYYIATTPQGLIMDSSILTKPQEGERQSSVNLNLLLPCASVPPNASMWDKICNETENPMQTTYSSKIAACEFDAKDPHCDGRKRLFSVWDSGDATPMSLPDGTNTTATIYAHQDIMPGLYQMFYINYKHDLGDRSPARDDMNAFLIPDVYLNVTGEGGVYAFTMGLDAKVYSTSAKNIFYLHTVVPRNHVSVLWQVPQYVLITAAEIMFSITGLEFSYSQAAPSLKSVVTAMFLLTVAFGDLLIIVLDLIIRMNNQAIIYFIYAGLMFVIMIIFVALSVFYYDYVDFSKDVDEDKTAQGTDTVSYDYCDDEQCTKL